MQAIMCCAGPRNLNMYLFELLYIILIYLLMCLLIFLLIYLLTCFLLTYLLIYLRIACWLAISHADAYAHECTCMHLFTGLFICPLTYLRAYLLIL